MEQGGQTILVAEDDPSIQHLLRFWLERSGYRVLLASDGARALELVKAEKPDLAVLDVMMPKMTGFEVLQAIRADPQTAGTGVVMLTAKGGDADVKRAYDAGTDDYLAKPFSPQELRARIEALLKRAAS